MLRGPPTTWQATAVTLRVVCSCSHHSNEAPHTSASFHESVPHVTHVTHVTNATRRTHAVLCQENCGHSSHALHVAMDGEQLMMVGPADVDQVSRASSCRHLDRPGVKWVRTWAEVMPTRTLDQAGGG